MVCLRLPDGSVTTNPAQMKAHAVNFYTELYRSEPCDQTCAADLQQGLTQLTQEERTDLDSTLCMEELTKAVMGIASGRAPGIDGLPADIYKHFWDVMGADLLQVLRESFQQGTLPLSCTRAALSLLPKKGDLTLLENWRPVALLCTDYKILSKVLANRLNHFMGLLIHKDQSYCVPDRSIMDNLSLMRDVMDISKLYGVDLGIVT